MTNPSPQRFRPIAVGLLFVALALAGCAAESGPDTPPSMSPSSRTTDGNGGDTGDGSSVEFVLAPSWQTGEWWRWRLTSADQSFEITAIVTQTSNASATLGFEFVDAALVAQWYHLPPSGAVPMETLAWMAHEQPVLFVDFPLFDGKEYGGTLEGTAINVTVTFTDQGDADLTATYENDRPALTATYSPSQQQFTRIDLLYGSTTPWASIELVDHGQAWADVAYDVLNVHDLTLGYAFVQSAPAASEEFATAPEATHAVFGCAAGAGPGSYQASLIVDNEPVASCDLRLAEASPSRTVHVGASPVASDAAGRVAATATGSGYLFWEALDATVRQADYTPSTA